MDDVLAIVYPEQILSVQVSVPVPPAVQTISIPGPPGPPGTDTVISYIAGAGGVRAFQVVYVTDIGTVMAATAQNEYHAGRIIGIATSNASEGEQVIVKRTGSVSTESWNLSPGERYFLNAGGELHTDTANMLFSQKIGIAEDTKTLFIQIDPPVIL